MKCRFILTSIIALVFCKVNAQEISKIRFEQDGSSINIYYDLKGDGEYDVKVYCSFDEGLSWGIPLSQVSGAVGKGQKAGIDKKITWNVLAEKDKLQGDIKFKLEAITGVYCVGFITVNHIAGSVAPVTKTTTYGTVTNIPGEPNKCWITSNLGATNQATSVDDATEASAGWYWQFNRKQGYKHDGTWLTPNTIWSSKIRKNSDWLPANDPCTIELGSGWRIPTHTEWNNVRNAGSWTSWHGPWNSGLKLHAAGGLRSSFGTSYNRGQSGYYWSSTQLDHSNGIYLFFLSNSCNMNSYNKAYGSTIRCLQD